MSAGQSPAHTREDRARGPFASYPIVVAHRGFSAVAPENTIAAYRKALEAGADHFECDVWMTSDGVPVVFHDDDLARITGAEGLITETPLETLRMLDAGSWKSPEFEGERIPTLAELIDWVQSESDDARPLGLVIEIKQAGMAEAVLDVIRSTDARLDELTVLAFALDHIEPLAKLEPGLRCIWLQEDLPPAEDRRKDIVDRARAAGMRGLGSDVKQVDRDFVDLAHTENFPVFVWTANETSDIQRILDIGVDAVISDHPDRALRILKASRTAE